MARSCGRAASPTCSVVARSRVGGHGKSTGVFAGWRWDGSQLTAKTDCSGFLPVYYACSDRAIWISTSVVRLLEEGVSPRLDVGALSVFLRYGNLAPDPPGYPVSSKPGLDSTSPENGLEERWAVDPLSSSSPAPHMSSRSAGIEMA